MSAPHAKSIDKKGLFIWDDTAKDFVAWDGNVTGSGGAGAATEATLLKIPGLAIPIHDYISLGYTGDNLTSVIFKTGGSSGTLVGTLTLAYSGSTLVSVTKT